MDRAQSKEAFMHFLFCCKLYMIIKFTNNITMLNKLKRKLQRKINQLKLSNSNTDLHVWRICWDLKLLDWSWASYAQYARSEKWEGSCMQSVFEFDMLTEAFEQGIRFYLPTKVINKFTALNVRVRWCFIHMKKYITGPVTHKMAKVHCFECRCECRYEGM